MKNKIFTSILFLFSLLVVFLPIAFVEAEPITGKSLGLFPCDGPDCGYGNVIALVDNIVRAVFTAILIITPLLIIRAGYYLITSGDKPEARTKAKNQMRNIFIGLFIVAVAYTVVKFTLSTLLGDTTGIPFF